MKKLLLSVTLLVAVCIGAKAQVSLGIKGGVNFSKISADNVKIPLLQVTKQAYLLALVVRFIYNQKSI